MSTRIENKLNLLIIDDDPSIIRLTETIVQNRLKDYYQVTAFTHPEDAKQWFNKNCCDVMLSDIQMPVTDGLGMLRMAKRRNAWTQVIFMTAHSSWDRIAEAIELGASDYLLKPLEEDIVVDVLKEQHTRQMRWKEALSGTLRGKNTLESSGT